MKKISIVILFFVFLQSHVDSDGANVHDEYGALRALHDENRDPRLIPLADDMKELLDKVMFYIRRSMRLQVNDKIFDLKHVPELGKLSGYFIKKDSKFRRALNNELLFQAVEQHGLSIALPQTFVYTFEGKDYSLSQAIPSDDVPIDQAMLKELILLIEITGFSDITRENVRVYDGRVYIIDTDDNSFFINKKTVKPEQIYQQLCAALSKLFLMNLAPEATLHLLVHLQQSKYLQFQAPREGRSTKQERIQKMRMPLNSRQNLGNQPASVHDCPRKKNKTQAPGEENSQSID